MAETQPKIAHRLRRLNRLKIFAKTNKILSGAKTRKEVIEIALEEFVRREKSKILVELEGKVEPSFPLPEFLKRRKIASFYDLEEEMLSL